MATLRSRCGHYFIFFFSLPNLSGHRLDVYHTSTHGMALVRIQSAGLKCAANGSLEMQDPKNCQKVAILAPSHNFVGLYLCNVIGKKLVKQQYLLHMPHNMAKFGILAAEIVSLV